MHAVAEGKACEAAWHDWLVWVGRRRSPGAATGSTVQATAHGQKWAAGWELLAASRTGVLEAPPRGLRQAAVGGLSLELDLQQDWL